MWAAVSAMSETSKVTLSQHKSFRGRQLVTHTYLSHAQIHMCTHTLTYIHIHIPWLSRETVSPSSSIYLKYTVDSWKLCWSYTGNENSESNLVWPVPISLPTSPWIEALQQQFLAAKHLQWDYGVCCLTYILWMCSSLGYLSFLFSTNLTLTLN